MREIKFRGKRIDNEEWVFGGSFDASEEEGLVTYIFDAIRGGTPCVVESIGQFTGFTDKNKVNIYAGDIIKTERNIVEVFFGNKKIHVFIYGKKDILEITGWLIRNRNGESDVLDSSFCKGEVIGNIYENPELLAVPTAVL